MSTKSNNLLFLNIKKSQLLLVVFVFMHVGIVIALILTPLPYSAMLLLIGGVCWGLLWSLRMHALRYSQGAVVSLTLDSDNNLALNLKDQDGEFQGRIVSQFVSFWIVLLSVRSIGRRRFRKIIIPYDAVDSELFRQLRLRLNVSRL